MAERKITDPKLRVAIVGGRGSGKTIQAYLEALEELEAYRALGTLEEIRFTKTVYEMSDDMYNSLASAIREKMAYQAIGTVEEFKMLKERLADDGK